MTAFLIQPHANHHYHHRNYSMDARAMRPTEAMPTTHPSTSLPFVFLTSSSPSLMMVTRAGDIRRVHNSEDEFRLSINVPGVKNLAVHLQSSVKATNVLVTGKLHDKTFFKTLDVPSRSLDFSQLHAKLLEDNQVLELVAPKSKHCCKSSMSLQHNGATLKIPIL